MGFSYFPLDTDFFADAAIRALCARHGAEGVSVYVYVLCEIYRRGYYLRPTPDFYTQCARALHVSEERVREVVATMAEHGLLDRANLAQGMMTSDEVRRRYRLMQRKREPPPTEEEVAAYCRTCGSRVSPALFCNYYAARNWQIDGVPVADWRALLRSWNARSPGGQKSGACRDDMKPHAPMTLCDEESITKGSLDVNAGFAAALYRTYGKDGK